MKLPECTIRHYVRQNAHDSFTGWKILAFGKISRVCKFQFEYCLFGFGGVVKYVPANHVQPLKIVFCLRRSTDENQSFVNKKTGNNCFR